MRVQATLNRVARPGLRSRTAVLTRTHRRCGWHVRLALSSQCISRVWPLGSYALCLLDSGASHSFVSSAWCRANGVTVRGKATVGRMADGSDLSLPGFLPRAALKLGAFRTKIDFYVADIGDIDVVLGSDFLHRFDPRVSWRNRSMILPSDSGPVTLCAYQNDNDLPQIHSDLVELCTIQAFSRMQEEVAPEDIAVAFVTPEAPSDGGKGADNPAVSAVLSEFSDVLRSELPPGLPPKRFAADGTPIEHVIETAPDAIPTRSKPFKTTPDELAEMKKQLEALTRAGFCQPSLSPWAAPVLLVRKKPDPVTGHSALRMCISYVRLNRITLNRIAYRLPRVSELLDKLTHATLFSKLDCISGYHQVGVRAEDQQKTAFCTPFGNYEFKVMPFGLCGAPSTFAYMMDEVFRESCELDSGARAEFESFVCVYLDDICILSRTEQEHIAHLRAVLQRLRKWKLYIKPSKCEWMQTSIEFLGHTITSAGRSVSHERAEALQNWPEPTTASEVRSCLGTFGFWREYISNYAHVVAPLTPLTGTGAPWRWGEEQRIALRNLKSAVLAAPVLMHADQARPFVVVTDASDYAVGASLEQDNAASERHPVAFFSHGMSKAERGYPVHERELLAIFLALRTWRHYLYNSDFTVECKTDHRPLQHFMEQSTLSGRQVRWQTFLSEFNLEISYMPGADNHFADGLSRRPDLRLMVIGAIAPYDPWLQRIQKAYELDPVARKLYNQSSGLKQNGRYKRAHGLLYFVAEGAFRVYVPDADELRPDLAREFHATPISGHFGHPKVYAAMSQHYYWPGMSDDVKRFVQACPVCQRINPTPQPRVQLYPLPVPSRPFQQITLDWVSGFPESNGKNAVFNIVDKFSKWAIVIPCTKHMSTKQLIDLLWSRVFSYAGLPESIVGDRDTRLRAREFRALCAHLQVRMKLSVAYHPQTDGATEIFNKTLIRMLRSYVEEFGSKWTEGIPALCYAYHNTVHSATGFTPHMLLHGWAPRDVRAPLTGLRPSGHPDVDTWLAQRASHFAGATERLERARTRMIAMQNASALAHKYKAHDLVKVSTRVLQPVDSGLPRKLRHQWVGPFSVVEEVNPGAIKLKLPEHYHLVHDTFSVHDIRPWLSHESHVLEPTYPVVLSHPAFNPIVQVVDRKSIGRAPRDAALIDIPATYKVLRRSGDAEWLREAHLETAEETALVNEKKKKKKKESGSSINPQKGHQPRPCVGAGHGAAANNG